MQDLVGEFNKAGWKELVKVLKDIEIWKEIWSTNFKYGHSDRTYYYQPRIKRARRIIKTYKN